MSDFQLLLIALWCYYLWRFQTDPIYRPTRRKR